jgi:SAM-dependent methyltransferase
MGLGVVHIMKHFIRKLPLVGSLAAWFYAALFGRSRTSRLRGVVSEHERSIAVLDSRTRILEDRLTKPNVAPFLVLDHGSYMQKAVEELPENQRVRLEDPDVFYYALESVFRDTAEVKQRQVLYLPYVEEANVRVKDGFFLDIGCGRGEFLTILGEHNIPARGVDTNRVMIEAARADGLDVTLADSLEFLGNLEDGSLKGVSMFQVAEHFDFSYLKELACSVFIKTAVGGTVIIETINPYSALSLATFYGDPTHVKPMRPETVKFLLEWQGFRHVQMIFSDPIYSPTSLESPLSNYSTYAIIGGR